MSKALEMIKLAREGNASRFGDMLVAGIQERVAAAVAEKRAKLYVKEGANPFAKKDEDEDKSDKDGDDKDSKSDKKDKDGDDDKEDDRKSVTEGLKLSDEEREKTGC